MQAGYWLIVLGCAAFAGNLWRQTSRPSGPSAVAAQIDRTSAAIIDAGLPRPTLFRPPFGRWEPFLDQAVTRRGMNISTWRVDSEDWKHPGDSDRVARRVISRAYPGGVVLLHDGHGRNNTTALRALPKILAALEARGYCFGKLAPSQVHNWHTSDDSLGRVRIVPPFAGCRKPIALTFDDGPDPDVTPSVLAVLRARRARATFFVQGARAERHPELLRAQARDGHAVGNHAWDHPNLVRMWLGHEVEPYDSRDDEYDYGD